MSRSKPRDGKSVRTLPASQSSGARLGFSAFNHARLEETPIDGPKDGDIFDIPESKSRRMLELRLLQNFISNTSPTLPATQNTDLLHSWSVEVPKLALQHDNLLYEILSLSAMHLLRTESQDKDIIEAQQKYHSLFLREHRKVVAQLCPANADAACFASALVLMDAFTSLRDRNMDPYTPPMEWLQMARGAGAVIREAIDSLENFETAKVMVLVEAKPFLNNSDVLFSCSNRAGYMNLLEQHLPGQIEVWDDETRSAYEKTLSYIGSIQRGMDDNEHVMSVSRRMMSFALMVPTKFIDLVAKKTPRALVILAHYFAVSAKLSSIWWVGDIPRREILGIHRMLADDWHMMMSLPLGAAGIKPDEVDIRPLKSLYIC